MTTTNYTKDIYVELSSPEAYGIEPPEGKTSADFKCWRTCTPTAFLSVLPAGVDVYQLSDKPSLTAALDETSNTSFTLNCYGNRRFNSGFKIKTSSVTKYPAFYAVWDRYGWHLDSLSADGYLLNNCIYDMTYELKNFVASDWKGYPSTRKEDDISIDDNSSIKFTIANNTSRHLKNVLLNNQYFAGISVDNKYWNENRDTLYNGIPEKLSANYIWESCLSAENAQKTFEFVISKYHVSADNMIHISCESETMEGKVLLYTNYAETLSSENS